MDKSRFLAKVLGIYFFVLSFAILFNVQCFVTNTIKLLQDPTLLFISGFFTLIIGTLMIVGHQVWCRDWRVMVTVLGWLIFIKGTCLVVCPVWMSNFSHYLIASFQYLTILTAFYLFLALFLCYKGFKKPRENAPGM